MLSLIHEAEEERSMDRNNVTMCIKGCGFYGSKENKNMCSKCYDDYLKAELIAKSSKLLDAAKKPIGPTNAPNPSVLDKSWPPQWIISAAKTTNTSNAVDSRANQTTSTIESGSGVKRRCEICNKKVGLIEFKCRCGHLYCGTHRYPKEHACTFDFKKFDREMLVKDNPLIRADKLEGRI